MAENSLDNLIKFIETDVYGREMREHIHDAFRILADSSLTAEEKAEIVALVAYPPVSYVPQELDEIQKGVARSNIGAAKAGDSGKGWTSEQIDMLETIFHAITYTDTSAQDTADALIESLRAVPQPEFVSITVAWKGGTIYSGSMFEKEMFEVKKVFDAGPPEVTTNYTITPDRAGAGDTEVTITSTDKQSIFKKITVPVTPRSITSLSNPTYEGNKIAGGPLEIDKFKVTAHYNDGDSSDLYVSSGSGLYLYQKNGSSETLITEGGTIEAAGTKTYCIKTGTLPGAVSSPDMDVTFEVDTIESISAEFNSQGTTLNVNDIVAEKINDTNLTVMKHYHYHDAIRAMANEYVLSPVKFTQGGSQRVTVSVGSISTEFDVNVVAPVVPVTASVTRLSGSKGTVSDAEWAAMVPNATKIYIKAEPTGTYAGICEGTLIKTSDNKWEWDTNQNHTVYTGSGSNTAAFVPETETESTPAESKRGVTVSGSTATINLGRRVVGSTPSNLQFGVNVPVNATIS